MGRSPVQRAYRLTALALAGAVALAGACATDPRYVDSQEVLEVGVEDATGMTTTTATTQLILPMRKEKEHELTARRALTRTLRMQYSRLDVPYVRLGDVSVSIEWLVRNLDDADGTARIHVSGGNELFYYVPTNFVIDPEEDEEPPPLLGDIPIQVPAGATVTGVFREDELYEAAVDLELITRGALNPFAATLQPHDDTTEIVDPMTGDGLVPAQAFGHLVQYDITLEANRHMVMEFVIRVRDERELLHKLLLDAPARELSRFTPEEFIPPTPPAAL